MSTDWRADLRELNAPPDVIAWADRASDDIGTAFASCTDPAARLWIARAGGASQLAIVDAIARCFDVARGIIDLGEASVEVDAALRVLHRRLRAEATEDDCERTADQLGAARFPWRDQTGDFAFALELALRATKDVSRHDPPHDFMWLVDANGAVRALVIGFKAKPVLPLARANELLSSLLARA